MRLRVAAILGILVVLLLSGGNWERVSAKGKKYARAKKVDEFGNASHCDLTARLDFLAIEIQKNPDAEAYILMYGPEGVGGTLRLLELFKEYLYNTRGLDPEKIKTLYGGRNSDPHSYLTELWMVPPGAVPPKPRKLKSNLDTFKGLFGEWKADDDFGIYLPPELGEVGVGSSTDASFADALQLQKNATGYIIAYNGEEASPGAWRTVADRQLDDLKAFNIDPKRMKVIFGGNQKETTVQLWIAPSDAPAPVADAGEEVPPAKAIKSGDFYDFHFIDKKNRAALFSRITKILREHDTLRALFVIRMEQPDPPEEDEPVEAVSTQVPLVPVMPEVPVIPEPVDSPEPPMEEFGQADLIKLIEEWRVELANTYKIGSDRFIIVFAAAGEYEPSYLELWMVPKGQPLPDLNQKKETEKEKDPPHRF
jgi:hypothetical protein